MIRVGAFHVLFIISCCINLNIDAMVIPGPTQQQQQQSTFVSRRTMLLRRLPLIVIGTTTGSGILNSDVISQQNVDNNHETNCVCSNCNNVSMKPNNNHFIVNAYERRDVGDANSSAETKAMNDQAYETNNRLERDGFKLETAAEQSATLTAALSDYSYSPSTSTKVKSTNSKSTSSSKRKLDD